MRTIKKIIWTTLLLLLFAGVHANAQFLKKVKNKAEKSVEKTILKKTDEKVSKETSKSVDVILSEDTDKKNKMDKSSTKQSKKNPSSIEEETQTEGGFKRGNILLYTDDFSKDAIGDFPAKWNSNLGGEIKKLKGYNEKFLMIPANAVINLETKKPFPDNFTVEINVIFPAEVPILMASIGFGKSVPKKIDHMLTDKENIRILFHAEESKTNSVLKFGTNSDALGYTYKEVNYKIPLNKIVALAFEINGTRMRVYTDGKKVIDLPKAFQQGFGNVLFLSAVTHGNKKSLENHFYVSNVVIAETGIDARSSVMKELIEKGKFTTNTITFSSGSDILNPSSKEILDQIGFSIKNHSSEKFLILGHTDSDGDANANLTLSKKRAEAVKKYLIDTHKINATQLETDGKGESQPISDNRTALGKEENRRVEFIKL